MPECRLRTDYIKCKIRAGEKDVRNLFGRVQLRVVFSSPNCPPALVITQKRFLEHVKKLNLDPLSTM